MKINKIVHLAFFLLLIASCGEGVLDGTEKEAAASYAAAVGGGSGQGNGDSNNSGLVTAGEWNDLDNWTFWKDLLENEEYNEMSDYWSFFTNNRVSVKVESSASPVVDAKVELKRNGVAVWTTRTDNLGRAELWVSAYQAEYSPQLSGLELYVNDVKVQQSVSFFENGTITVNTTPGDTSENQVELCFIVDATGSMGDEIEFLKADLNDVITKVEQGNSAIDIYTSAVFYRDEGDEYVTRQSAFTSKLSTTINFIKDQNADGGNDFPEAVHTALDKGINSLQWSSSARTRIAFLILDAPPHYETPVVNSMQQSIKKAAEKGIKVIPVTASGIDKKTEFLMRYMAILTNGTYVFITNDSGIGNEHIEASVGEYEVEKLNALLIRLIKKYSD